MASDKELKGTIRIRDLASKEFKKMRREIKQLRRESKELDKALNKKKRVSADTKEASKKLKDLNKDIKKAGKGTKIPVSLKDMASKGLTLIKGKAKEMGKAGEMLIKIVGKHPALRVLGVVGLGIAKLAKSAYNDIKLRLNDMTQWGIQKVQQGLASLKDKVIKVTIEGYDEYSDFKARASSINKGMSFKDYDKLMGRTARNTRSSVADTRAGITKLMQMSPEVFGGKANDAAKFYQTAMQSFRKGGSSNEEASAAMYQLNQGLASGTLQGDELRSVRENAPLMAKMIEKEVGMGIKEAGKKGILTSEVVKNAILKHSEEVNRQFKNIPMNFKDAWVIANNLLETSVFAPMYERMQTFISSDKVRVFFDGIYQKASDTFDGMWKLLDMTDFGGIDLSKLWNSMGPVKDLFNDIYTNIVNRTPEAQDAINTLGEVVNGAFEGMGDIMQFFADVARDIFQFLKENPEFVKNAIKLLASDWKDKWAFMKLKLKIANDYILPALSTLKGLLAGIKNALGDLYSKWKKVQSFIKNNPIIGKVATGIGGVVGQVLGSAYGKSRVPYDNYPARLHEGEKVLTKQEANQYDNNKGKASGFNIIIQGLTVREEADIDLIADRMVKKMNIAIAGGV
ncbi:tape measure protein [Peptostreptococcus sp.]|uniref:tape measure protein n=1 Tax=Peptostreptococcus sp. TaxID=1262 RepID=UPI001D86B915|nr:tape measure protein [Peptostreptococcus sp.]MBS5595663.1 tape measure protein [Peptostreptococcus sp.]